MTIKAKKIKQKVKTKSLIHNRASNAKSTTSFKSANYHERFSKSYNQSSNITGSISLRQTATTASRSISNQTSKGSPTIKQHMFHSCKRYKRKSTT
jgi:SLT domain-containing protein